MKETCDECYEVHGPMLATLDTYDWKSAFKYADGLYGVPCDQPHTHTIPEDMDYWTGESGEHKGKPFNREDVAEVIASAEGENEGPFWLALVRLKDGRFGFLAAGCDYSGWGCQEGGRSFVASDLDTLVRFAVTPESRARLGL